MQCHVKHVLFPCRDGQDLIFVYGSNISGAKIVFC